MSSEVTEAQAQAIAAYETYGSYGEAAKRLGVSKGTVFNHVKRAKEAALITGGIPNGYKVKDVKTAYDAHGEIKGQTVRVAEGDNDADQTQEINSRLTIKETTTLYKAGEVSLTWVKRSVEEEKKATLWAEYAAELIKPIDPASLLEPLPARVLPPENLCAVYPIGDYHVGMMAWGLETRSDNWDIKLAEQLLARAAESLMRGAPPSEQCVLAFMGDFVHFDGYRPETPAHKNLVDADTRFGKVGRVAIRIVRHIIAAARRYHDKVHVVFLGGNHDPAVAELINVFLGEFYCDDPQVTVDMSPSYFRYFEYGQNLLGFAHGDKCKKERMPMIMAADMREAWGRTKHRLILTGHVHHESRSDNYGVAIETVPVLIPNDAYSASAGYRATRAMQVLVLDREFGEDQRHTFNAERFYRSID